MAKNFTFQAREISWLARILTIQKVEVQVQFGWEGIS